MTSLTIGQAAKQTGISHDTIRLYERYNFYPWQTKIMALTMTSIHKSPAPSPCVLFG